MSGVLREQRGVEPLAMKIFAGLVLLVIGLGIGYAVYTSIKAPSFTVVASPSSKTIGIPVTGENTHTIQVKMERLLEYDKTVSLSAVTPDNVLVSFSPDSGTPTFESTMTIKVGSAAQAGKTTITIRATGTDGTDASGAFVLEIV